MNRHERRKAENLTYKAYPSDPTVRGRAFLEAFWAAPDDADIEIRVGRSRKGKTAILISLCGAEHPFFIQEARGMAHVMEEVMRKYPHEPAALALPNIIMAIRYACEEAEKSNDAPQ